MTDRANPVVHLLILKCPMATPSSLGMILIFYFLSQKGFSKRWRQRAWGRRMRGEWRRRSRRVRPSGFTFITSFETESQIGFIVEVVLVDSKWFDLLKIQNDDYHFRCITNRTVYYYSYSDSKRSRSSGQIKMYKNNYRNENGPPRISICHQRAVHKREIS